MQAYKKIARESMDLSGLTDFTEDQLFFIAFGQVST